MLIFHKTQHLEVDRIITYYVGLCLMNAKIWFKQLLVRVCYQIQITLNSSH